MQAPNVHIDFQRVRLDSHDINGISRIIGLNQVNACIEKNCHSDR